MTKRKVTQKPNTIINPTPPKQAVESDKDESNTVAAPKPKRANSKAPAKPRGRPKKAVVEKPVPPEGRVGYEHQMPAPVSKAVDVASRTITYVSAGNAVPSKYEQFKSWLVYRLYVVTSYFRGY